MSLCLASEADGIVMAQGKISNSVSLAPKLLVEACVAKRLTPRTLDLEVRVSTLARRVVSLDKELYSALSLSAQVYKWVPAIYCWRVTLRWTSIPSKGGVAILLGMFHAKETGMLCCRSGLWLVCTFIYSCFLTKLLRRQKATAFPPLIAPTTQATLFSATAVSNSTNTAEWLACAFFQEFLLKHQPLRACYLAFDWSGWIVLIKVKSSLWLEWSGRLVLTNGKRPKRARKCCSLIKAKY